MSQLQADCSARLDNDPLAHCTGTWWVAVTRPRYEDRLARDVRDDQGNTVIVQERVTRIEYDAKGHRHRHNETRKLFPGYVFVNGDFDYLDAVRKSLATIQIIEVKNQERLHRELSQLIYVTNEIPNLSAVRIEPGHQVGIIRGPLRGMIGYVIESKPGRLYVQMSILGSAVEIPPDFVEPA